MAFFFSLSLSIIITWQGAFLAPLMRTVPKQLAIAAADDQFVHGFGVLTFALDFSGILLASVLIGGHGWGRSRYLIVRMARRTLPFATCSAWFAAVAAYPSFEHYKCRWKHAPKSPSRLVEPCWERPAQPVARWSPRDPTVSYSSMNVDHQISVDVTEPGHGSAGKHIKYHFLRGAGFSVWNGNNFGPTTVSMAMRADFASREFGLQVTAIVLAPRWRA